MAKVYIFLAEGFEEIEGLTVVDILRRAGITIEMVALGSEKKVTGSHGISVEADVTFDEKDLTDGDLYVLPGGMPGTKCLAGDRRLGKLLTWAKAEGKKVAAICAAPSVLGGLGLLEGETATCYPGFEEKLTGAKISTEEVVISGQMTTSRGMGTAIPFALELVAQLKSREESEKLRKGIIYRV